MKPSPVYLTRFYLMISVGGAVGSVLVGILAPMLLPGYFELAAALVVCALLMFWRVRTDALVFRGLAVMAALFAAGCAVWSTQNFFEDTIASSRNFYGVVRVLELGDEPTDRHRSLIHGTILHGTQYLDPKLRRQATTYYTATSGVARVIESKHPRLAPLKVGVIGLGTGTLAVWGTKGDTYRFYEINPDVATVAKRDFTYLADSEATAEIALGDARLNLEREPVQGFDVLAIDAFSSDAIPVHLITQEALDIYLRHMKPDGVIAFHVTNRFLDLAPVVEALAHERGLASMLISDDPDDSLASRSDWVLVTRDPKALENPKVKDAAFPLEPRRDWRIWTDSFNNLLQVLR